MPSPDAMSPSGLKSGSQFYPSYPNNPRRRPPDGGIGKIGFVFCHSPFLSAFLFFILFFYVFFFVQLFISCTVIVWFFVVVFLSTLGKKNSSKQRHVQMNAQQRFIHADRHAHACCIVFSLLCSALKIGAGIWRYSTWTDITFSNLSLSSPYLCFCLSFHLFLNVSCLPGQRHPAKEDSETPWSAVLGESLFLLAFTAHS